jgi:hypothetical protein
MRMSKRRDGGVRDGCARWEEDDGVDPRQDALRERAEARRANEKRFSARDAALAKVAARAVEQELLTRGVAIEHGLSVAHVEVLAGGAHVRVWVVPDAPMRDGAHVREWVFGVAPALRAALASRLARKRVPTLSIELGSAPMRVREAREDGGVG